MTSKKSKKSSQGAESATPNEVRSQDAGRMEPQHFKPKRWARFLQTASGALVIIMGASALQASSIPIGLAAIVIGMFTLGQGMYAEVTVTEDDLRVRRNMWKAVVTPWEEIDYCMRGNPIAVRLMTGKVLRLLPLIDDVNELRSMIDDTVGPPP
jgi:hypothetical protein